MKDVIQHNETMTPEEKFLGVKRLSCELEENFIQLGQLLSEIKQTKLYRFKGYENFKDFVQAEYALNSTLANKLVAVYDTYVADMDLSDDAITEIGFDRLCMVRSFVEKADLTARNGWILIANQMPANELSEYIKEVKAKDKKLNKDIKDVLIEQYLEKMRTWFNCSAKELNFKLALYFQDANLEAVRADIKVKQRKFEAELQASQDGALADTTRLEACATGGDNA
jgi:hypothetical protein